MKSLKAMITGLFLVGCTSSVTYETISAKDAKERPVIIEIGRAHV